ncbi:MAG TPA: hypothetical protein VKB65_01390 [Myxococcota bacterium]|nr:hypothetical protein [Myxococcota bacterium]
MRLFWPTIDMLIEAPGVVAAPAVCLDPAWFPSLGPPPAGGATLDTDALEGVGFDGRGVVFQQAHTRPEIAVFTFDGGRLEGEITVRGSRPAALLFHRSVLVRARIDARAAGARREGPGLAAAPGAGGGFGGGGGAPEHESRGGPAYGLGEVFEVGSGGQHGTSRGGLAGGGVQLGARGSLELCGSRIDADGEPGELALEGVAGGGGSGGAVILHGARVRLDPETSISVRGGAGGAGLADARAGGGGAGGWVLGACEAPGFFDPRGARFRTRGGSGGRNGRSRSTAPGGADGERGVVYLAAQRALAWRPAHTAGRVEARA